MGGSAIATYFSVFGAAMTAKADVDAGNAQNDIAVSNSKIALANAATADFSAKDAVERGAADEATHRSQTKQLIGKQRVTLAAQGQDLTSGTGLDIQTDTARQSEIDALTIRANAAREAYGYKVQSYGSQVQAQDDLLQGQIAKAKGRNDAFSTIVTEGSQLIQQKYGKK